MKCSASLHPVFRSSRINLSVAASHGSFWKCVACVNCRRCSGMSRLLVRGQTEEVCTAQQVATSLPFCSRSREGSNRAAKPYWQVCSRSCGLITLATNYLYTCWMCVVSHFGKIIICCLMTTMLAQVPHCAYRPLSATQAVEQQTKAELSGKWQKDKSQSDSMQQACDVVELKWVLRRALAILNTLEVLTCAARSCTS